MKAIACILLFIMQANALCSQIDALSPASFFGSDSMLQVTFTTDIKGLRSSKNHPTWQPATIAIKFNDSLTITGHIRVRVRGNVRKDVCDFATLQIDCNALPQLSKLGKLKWVGGCRKGNFDEELLQREYLVYKLYNQLTPLSFKVRLMKVTYNDTRQKMKPYEQFAFLIEDIADVGHRNLCTEKKSGVFKTEGINRLQATSLSVFQYMVGNTDWSVPNRHNIKLLVPMADTNSRPLVIPYDFDYAGIVNALYAVPRQELGIPSVRVRSYRGFRRTIEEADSIIAVFKQKQDEFLKVVVNYPYLQEKARQDMLGYINSFYTLINKEANVKRIFVNDARLQ